MSRTMPPDETDPELWPEAPPPLSMAEQLALHRAELEDLRRLFAGAGLSDDGKALGRAVIAHAESRVRDLEALAGDEARPDVVVDCQVSRD